MREVQGWRWKGKMGNSESRTGDATGSLSASGSSLAAAQPGAVMWADEWCLGESMVL